MESSMSLLVRPLRGLLRIRPATITREQALAIARAECERRGYAWEEPVLLEERLREYWIMTRADHRGGNVLIDVDIHTGVVKRFRVSPR